MKTAFECLLLLTLIACAILAPRAKKLLSAVILYTSFGLLLSVVWLLLEAPDLAITEAALGAGVTGILFFLTLQQVNALKGTKNGKK